MNPLVKLNRSVPQASTTSTEPGACSGVVAVIEVALMKALLAAGTSPNRIVQSLRRLRPFNVTAVPPAAGPFDGRICVIAGVVGASVTWTSTNATTAFP